METTVAASGPKAQILHCAAHCFMERGFHATTIDDVARRMGATKGIVYHHYASKLDLFFGVYRVGMEALLMAVTQAQAGGGGALERLERMLHAHVLAMFEHHAFENVVAQGVQLQRFCALTPPQRVVLEGLVQSRRRLEGLYRELLEEARRMGCLAPGLDVSIAAKTILGGVHWSLIWYRPEADKGPAERERLARQMVRTLVHGVASRN